MWLAGQRQKGIRSHRRETGEVRIQNPSCHAARDGQESRAPDSPGWGRWWRRCPAGGRRRHRLTDRLPGPPLCPVSGSQASPISATCTKLAFAILPRPQRGLHSPSRHLFPLLLAFNLIPHRMLMVRKVLFEGIDLENYRGRQHQNLQAAGLSSTELQLMLQFKVKDLLLILGWPKCSFRFFHIIVWKHPNFLTNPI